MFFEESEYEGCKQKIREGKRQDTARASELERGRIPLDTKTRGDPGAVHRPTSSFNQKMHPTQTS